MKFFYTLHSDYFFMPAKQAKRREIKTITFLEIPFLFFASFRVLRGEIFLYFPNRFLSAAENSSVSLYFGIRLELAIFIPMASEYSAS